MYVSLLKCLFISFVLVFAFAYDESGNPFTSRPLGHLGGLGLVVALLGFPLVYGYLMHIQKRVKN